MPSAGRQKKWGGNARGPDRKRLPPPDRRRKRRKDGEGRQERNKVPRFIDVHVRVGLEDELVRLTPEHWFKLINHWMIGGEDVIIRLPFESHEMNIVLRGSSNGALSVRDFDRTKKLPQGQVLLPEDLRETLLKEQGL